MLAATVLTAALAAASWYATAPAGDRVPEGQRQQRLATFDGLAPLPLDLVAPGDMQRALGSMELTGPAQQLLQADLAQQPDAGAPQSAPVPDTAAAAPRTQLAPAPAPAAAETRPLRLAWITLWDTDAQDGDTVRIDSQGYSRTVVLRKQPLSFAIPVPADGLVRVTGIRDGDGGGITVGLASGGAQAVFPIMSEGQVLGLKVRFD